MILASAASATPSLRSWDVSRDNAALRFYSATVVSRPDPRPDHAEVSLDSGGLAFDALSDYFESNPAFDRVFSGSIYSRGGDTTTSTSGYNSTGSTTQFLYRLNSAFAYSESVEEGKAATANASQAAWRDQGPPDTGKNHGPPRQAVFDVLKRLRDSERTIIFSYSTEDRAKVDYLKPLFHNAGLDIWCAPDNLELGAEFLEVIHQQIGKPGSGLLV